MSSEIEAFKAAGELAIATAEKTGVIGAIGNALGLHGGDWLGQQRFLNADRLKREAEAILKQRDAGARIEDASLTVLLPIFKNATDESRDDLRELWAKLLASAVDPKTARRFRTSFTETLSRLDPIDALVLSYVGRFARNARPGGDSLAGDSAIQKDLHISRAELSVTYKHLESLSLCRGPAGSSSIGLTEYGSLLFDFLEPTLRR